jgi:hypothetical protein
MEVYEVMKNIDQTEGRGPMVSAALLSDEAEAVEYAKKLLNKYIGGAEVWKVDVFESAAEVLEHLPNRVKIFGYRRDRVGKWGYGYLDNRETLPLERDPEYQEYVRLSKIYGRG